MSLDQKTDPLLGLRKKVDDPPPIERKRKGHSTFSSSSAVFELCSPFLAQRQMLRLI
jgi:hypothetical protein